MDNAEFLTSEHLAGFHDKVTEGCYECWREQRIISAKKTVDAIYPDGRNQHALDRLDYGEHNRNPLD
jgi:hypothetical protein